VTYLIKEPCLDVDTATAANAGVIDVGAREQQATAGRPHVIAQDGVRHPQTTIISPGPHAQSSAAVDDSGAGLAMFLIFTAAVLIVTGAVAVVALVGTWWMLGVAFAVDLAMTTIVVLTIVAVMAGRDHVIVRRGRTPPARGGRLSRAPGRPTTAL
jgi:hypothetical protein